MDKVLSPVTQTLKQNASMINLVLLSLILMLLFPIKHFLSLDIQDRVNQELKTLTNKESDIISLHVPLTKETTNLINLNVLKLIKSTSFIINTSRGGIVNEDDLIIALSTNVIAGAGIDVYEKEPLPETHKLRFLPNALLLPHLGYVTAENYSIFYSQMIENLESCVSGKPIRVIE